MLPTVNDFNRYIIFLEKFKGRNKFWRNSVLINNIFTLKYSTKNDFLVSDCELCNVLTSGQPLLS
jgi:hypothetical protein